MHTHTTTDWGIGARTRTLMGKRARCQGGRARTRRHYIVQSCAMDIARFRSRWSCQSGGLRQECKRAVKARKMIIPRARIGRDIMKIIQPIINMALTLRKVLVIQNGTYTRNLQLYATVPESLGDAKWKHEIRKHSDINVLIRHFKCL